MRIPALALLLSWTPAWGAVPAPPAPRTAAPVLMRALSDELSRESARLRLDSLEKPYFLSYSALDGRFDAIECGFGSPVESYGFADRELRVDVRVGSATFDNSHFAQSSAGYRAATGDLPVENDYDAVRAAAWSLTDDAYKDALQVLSEKRAYKEERNITDEPPDLSTEPIHRALLGAGRLDFDRKAWEGPVCALSALFRRYPAIQSSAVVMEVQQGTRYFVNSEGTAERWPDATVRLTVYARTQAVDGMPAERRLRYAFRSLSELPPMKTLEADTEGFAQRLSDWTRAAEFDGYIGPVLFEGQASGEFFNQLFARELANPRAPWVDNDDYQRWYPAGALTNRVGLRVTAPFLSVLDDPTRTSFEGVPLAGRYSIDEEGVPARPVALVVDGRLKDLLMTRSPVKGHARSNGHARGSFHDVPGARSSNLIVTASRTVSDKKLRKKLLSLAREAGLPYGILVRRLAPDDQKDFDAPLSAPTEIYRVYVKDGRQELVRDAEFADVSPRALRDIVAVSKQRYVYNYFQSGRLYGSQGDVPCSVVAPAILVEEMELKKTDKKPEKLPYLPHPYFALNGGGPASR